MSLDSDVKSVASFKDALEVLKDEDDLNNNILGGGMS